ncbi:suppressor of MAX2 1-like protein, partial [Tanacetum coccineum]
SIGIDIPVHLGLTLVKRIQFHLRHYGCPGFVTPDRVGKKKMCLVLAEHVCGANPITIDLGSRRDVEETNMGFRGKNVFDGIVKAVHRNPSFVIVLSDIDEADMLVHESIKRAIERGRITDSHGREISLGNVVFVLIRNWSNVNFNKHQVAE